jgi:hypothetical protein
MVVMVMFQREGLILKFVVNISVYLCLNFNVKIKISFLL